MGFRGFGDLSEKTTIKQYFEDQQHFAHRAYGNVKTTPLDNDYEVKRCIANENIIFVSNKIDGKRYCAKVYTNFLIDIILNFI